MIPLTQNFKTIILADGNFPKHPIPLDFLRNAERIICCDGSTEHLLAAGLEPDYIVGDLDSISTEHKTHFAAILRHNPEQETNDLTKTVRFCVDNHWKEITILGATGKREDHTLGNLSLLCDYAEIANIQLLTDHGVFNSQTNTTTYESYSGQQVSIFAISPNTLLTFHNLAYPAVNKNLTSWWQGTLNKSFAENFTIECDYGKILVFREY